MKAMTNMGKRVRFEHAETPEVIGVKEFPLLPKVNTEVNNSYNLTPPELHAPSDSCRHQGKSGGAKRSRRLRALASPPPP